MASVKIWVCVLGALLSGCVTSGIGDRFGATPVNYASGSVLGARLTIADQRALEASFVQALQNGIDGERYDWRGPSAFGWVKADQRSLGNLRPGNEDMLLYPAKLHLASPLETELGLHVLTRNGNVRLGPSTSQPVLTQLSSGTGVDAVGRVVDGEWILAAIDNKVVGYIFADLLIKAPGTEFELAGGPTRLPVQCRSFEQRISFQNRSDRWQGRACLSDGEWVLTPRRENEPVLLN